VVASGGVVGLDKGAERGVSANLSGRWAHATGEKERDYLHPPELVVLPGVHRDGADEARRREMRGHAAREGRGLA
jgi:hypothetical protein